jgi:hypothetical protein
MGFAVQSITTAGAILSLLRLPIPPPPRMGDPNRLTVWVKKKCGSIDIKVTQVHKSYLCRGRLDYIKDII